LPFLTGEKINQLIKKQTNFTIKRSVVNRKDIYKDKLENQIISALREQFTFDTTDYLKPLISQELNLFKRVVKETSMLYKNPAERNAVLNDDEENPQLDPVYEKLKEDFNFDVFMMNVNRMTRATNQTLLHPVWRNGKMDFDLLTFDNCEIMSDPDDWKKIIAVKYYIGLNVPYYDDFVNVTQDGKVKDPQATSSADLQQNTDFTDYAYSYLWTIEGDKSFVYKYQKGTLQEEQLVDTQESPYKDKEGKPILPFVLITQNYPIDTLLDFTTGNDLIDLTMNTAVDYVNYNNIKKYSAWKNLYALVDDPSTIPENIALSPNKMMVIPRGQDNNNSIGLLDSQSNLKDFLLNMIERIRIGIAQYGMDAESFTRSGNGESGFKLKVKKEGLIEIREEQIPNYTDKEKELFEITRIVNNTHNAEKINENAEFNINFADMAFEVDSEAENRNWVVKINNNIRTAIDWIMADDPDLDEEQAIARFNANKTFNDLNNPNVQLQQIKKPGENNLNNKGANNALRNNPKKEEKKEKEING
jgi:hypothetical protein